MSTKKMTISMPAELYESMARISDRNWSAIARRSIEQEVRICEAIAAGDRVAALREKAKADCSDVRAAGLEDAVSYPIEEISYRFLREFEARGRPYVEGGDPENLIAEFDQRNQGFHDNGDPAFRLRFQDWDYKLSFIEGVLRLKRIADGADEPERPSSAAPARLKRPVGKTSAG
jgi:hypothetical protein